MSKKTPHSKKPTTNYPLYPLYPLPTTTPYPLPTAHYPPHYTLLTRATTLTRCSLFGGKLTGGSQINHELLTVLSQGSMRLNRGECATVRPIVDTVVQLMTVPLILTPILTPTLTLKLNPDRELN